ncbi:FAD-dependent oxidoreductase [uncultured Parasutterella sp.]|jgi:Succinate dehydrogenase/fumarate reductase, flavoprotein subunit|uniref:FAD-dependent oxidoreductase n=1 Tax=uncultured Parasutterella sp. TaxID=1263098 RepID=UPI00258A11AF|nr:FAD-dependent oxidoreductase [uncultured Parasutterella sp.]
MKRKLNLLSVSVLLAMSMSAAQAVEFIPGTYTAAAKGNGGDVPVTVTFSKDKIEKIQVGTNKETPGIGSVAIEQVPAAIVKNQSLAVNAVAGASITSKAILAAIAACVSKAGANPEALQTTVQKQAQKAEEKTLNADIAIVGAGAAGQTAAIRASQLGKKVILLEKMPFAGGAAAVNGGTVVIQGSKIQKDAGVKDDSPEIMTEDYIKNGHGLNDKRMLDLYVHNVGSMIDWATTDGGMQLNTKAGFTNEAEHSKPRVMRWVDGAQGATRNFKASVEKSGAKVMLGTPVEEITLNNGAVTGVKAKGNDGVLYTIKAPAVILTTGGFGANKDMLTGNLKNALYYGVKSSNGDGHRMAMKIGAKTQMMDLGKIYPNGMEVAPGIAKSTIWSNKAAFEDNSGIMVNRAGKRVISELDTNHNIKNEEVKQGGKLFILMDQKTYDAFLTKLNITGISKGDMDNWLAQDGKGYPIVVKADSIPAVAKKAGVNGAELQKTVARYNTFVQNGKDEEFNRPAKFMKTQVSLTGPYYIVEQQPRFATTMGGVVTDRTLNVVNKQDKPIKGLFAAGELVGGAMGDDSPPGGNMAWAMTSGKLAAESAVKFLNK